MPPPVLNIAANYTGIFRPMDDDIEFNQFGLVLVVWRGRFDKATAKALPFALGGLLAQLLHFVFQHIQTISSPKAMLAVEAGLGIRS